MTDNCWTDSNNLPFMYNEEGTSMIDDIYDLGLDIIGDLYYITFGEYPDWNRDHMSVLKELNERIEDLKDLRSW